MHKPHLLREAMGIAQLHDAEQCGGEKTIHGTEAIS